MPWTVDELSAHTGLGRRQIRRYTELGIILGAQRPGPHAPYDDADLARILAAQRLVREGVPLARVRVELYAMGTDALRTFAGLPPTAVTNAPAVAMDPSRGTSQAVTAGTLEGADEWQRVVLLPGVELMVRRDVTPAALRAAQEIVANYRVGV